MGTCRAAVVVAAVDLPSHQMARMPRALPLPGHDPIFSVFRGGEKRRSRTTRRGTFSGEEADVESRPRLRFVISSAVRKELGFGPVA